MKTVYYIPEGIKDLDGYNCTVGSAMRMVLYDSPNLRRTYNIFQGYHLKGGVWFPDRL